MRILQETQTTWRKGCLRGNWKEKRELVMQNEWIWGFCKRICPTLWELQVIQDGSGNRLGEGNRGKTEERTEGPACFWRSQRDLLLCHTKKFGCDSEDKAHKSDFPSENKQLLLHGLQISEVLTGKHILSYEEMNLLYNNPTESQMWQFGFLNSLRRQQPKCTNLQFTDYQENVLNLVEKSRKTKEVKRHQFYI